MKKSTVLLRKMLSALLGAVMLFTWSPALSADNGAIDEQPLSTTVSDALEDANKLYKLGLFKGVGTNDDGTPNFELERTATRNEAVTMLVRLLGKDEAANSTEWNIPFTDVNKWALPYVGYAYNFALTGGTSADTFGGNADVTAAQYVTFVLRALGYVSEIHFPWHSPWELSDSIGLTNGEYDGDTVNFNRADIVLISTRALKVKIKNSEQTLAEKLIGEGVIERRDYVEIIEGGVYEEALPVWDGSALPFEGRGTKSKPYLIESAENLAQLAIDVAQGNNYGGKFFRMTTDIDLGMQEWTPIGSYDNPFKGIFDGDGHTVNNMYISETPSGDYVGAWNQWHNYMGMVGLFSTLGGGEIRNLSVNGQIKIAVDSTVDKYYICVGAIVGLASSKITNCHSDCTVTVTSESNQGYISVGGIAGNYYTEKALIKNCTNSGNVGGYGLHCVRIGGIAGSNAEGGEIRGCTNYGAVISEILGNISECTAGGITAKTYNSVISGCKNYGKVSARNRAGGIVGYQNGDDAELALIENCLGAGNVTGAQCGGIAGALYAGTIRNSNWTTDDTSLAISRQSDGTYVKNVTAVKRSDISK